MGAKLPLPVKAATHKFFVGDLQTIAEFHPQKGMKNAIVRQLIHEYAKNLREQQSRSEPPHDAIASIAKSVSISGITDRSEPADDDED